MTHSSRPTLIFNSVISKITPAFSLRHVEREKAPFSPAELSQVLFVFFLIPHTVNIAERRPGEGLRKLKRWSRVLTERGEETHCMEVWTALKRSWSRFGATSPDLKSPWPHLLTLTVAAPVAPSHHTLLLLTVLSQGCPGQDKDCGRWLALSEWGTGCRHIDGEGSVSQSASG